jgi:hypothetical protein
MSQLIYEFYLGIRSGREMVKLSVIRCNEQ